MPLVDRVVPLVQTQVAIEDHGGEAGGGGGGRIGIAVLQLDHEITVDFFAAHDDAVLRIVKDMLDAFLKMGREHLAQPRLLDLRGEGEDHLGVAAPAFDFIDLRSHDEPAVLRHAFGPV